jgi:hypothetical protein
MKIITWLLYGWKITFLKIKIIINIFGLGGWATLLLSYFNFFHIIWFPLGILLEKIFQNQWFGGLMGILISNNLLFFIPWMMLLSSIIIYFFFQWGTNTDIKKSFTIINKSPIINLIKNLSFNIIKQNSHNNNFFFNITLEVKKTIYPMAYIYYDLNLIIDEKFNVLVESFKGNYLLTIVINYKNQFNINYLKKRKIFYMINHWNYLFFYIMGQRNFINLGINHHNQLMIIHIKKLYNFFIIDKHNQFTMEYNNQYIFKEVMNNPNNIIYLVHNNPSENILDHYKNLVNYLENAFTQSKINNKSIVVFLYYQLEVFSIEHKKLMDYIKFLIKNSIGYFNVFIIEKNSQVLLNFFYQNDTFIDHNSAIFFNGVDNNNHSKILTGTYGFEMTNLCYFKDFKNNYYCQLPYNDI